MQIHIRMDLLKDNENDRKNEKDELAKVPSKI